jgi:hypothetical protein
VLEPLELWDANALEVMDDKTFVMNLKEPQVAVPEHLFHYQAFILHPSENGKWGPGGLCTGARTVWGVHTPPEYRTSVAKCRYGMCVSASSASAGGWELTKNSTSPRA